MKIDIEMKKITTRQYLMAGVVLAFVLTLILGNYGIYMHIAHERYVIKESLMDKIESNVDNLECVLDAGDRNVTFFNEWLLQQLGNGQAHSIIEDIHMADMIYDESLERTYNSEVIGDKVGILMIYDGYLKNMPADLRVEMNRIFEGYQNQRFMQSTLIPSAKVILNSSYGYTAIVPYDRAIDGNERAALVDYYEHFNQLSTAELNQWQLQMLPDSDELYYGKTIALEGGASDRYLMTILLPVTEFAQALHSYDQNYHFYVIDDKQQLLINDFKVVDHQNGESFELDTVLAKSEYLEDMTYPFMKKIKNDYIIGHPIKSSDWKALAVFDESAIGKNTLFKTSAFYMLNLLFIAIFSFLVVMVNKHLTELEK